MIGHTVCVVSDAQDGGGRTWATLLRATRKARGWTQDELADAAGVHRTTIIRWENGGGGFEPDTLAKVADTLAIPREQVLVAVGLSSSDVPMPPPLPRELARLVDAYNRMSESERQQLLGHVEVLTEWAETRLADPPATQRRPRRAG